MNKEKENNKPIYKKWWFWLIIILLLCIFSSNMNNTDNSINNNTITNTIKNNVENDIATNTITNDTTNSKIENNNITNIEKNNTPIDMELMSYAQLVLEDNLNNPKYSRSTSDYTFITTLLRTKIEGTVTVNSISNKFYMIIEFVDDTYKEYDLISLQVGNEIIYKK